MQDFTETRENIKISVIIPIYNGSKLLEKHLTPFLYYLNNKRYNFEIVLVDDGSIDVNDTRDYAERYRLNFVEIGSNKGKGNALRIGFGTASGVIQIFTDIDIPFQYSNFDLMVEILKKDPDQLIIGDRTHPESIYFEASPFARNLGSSMVSIIVNKFFFNGIKDTQCGLKGMGVSISKKLFAYSFINRFAIDVELIYLAKKFSVPVQKCPVQLRFNDKSSINVLSDGIELLYDIGRIWWHHRKEKRVRVGDKVYIGGDYQYKAYYYGSFPQRYWNQFKISTAIENLDLDGAYQMLDAGCGSGILCSVIAERNSTVQITGIDSNPRAISFCTTKWKHFTNLCFVQNRVDDLIYFKDNSVDRVALLEVIEHITTAQSKHVLSEFNRILRKDGVLVISTPNRKSLWPAIEYILDFLKLTPKLKNEQHEVLYSGKELAKLVKDQGFVLKRKQTINFIAPWIAFFSKKMAQNIHTWESKKEWIPGSLLLYTFIKKQTE